MKNTLLIPLVLTLALSLNACLYKMDIHQGNILDDDKISQLKTGMGKAEVMALLGSPQVADPFHVQRWDYYSSSNRKNRTEQNQKSVTLMFKGDRLDEIIK